MVVFGFLHTTFWSALPLDEGDRVVALMNYDAVANRRRSPSFQDFERWRDVLQSVEEVGAFRTIERSLVIGNGSAEPVPATVSIAKITASAFGLARVPPLLGRPLVEEDERKGAPPVVVIGHDVWRTRFASDPSVVGQRVRLGGTVHGVVGVMPEGFAFPVNHSFWTPLGAFPSDFTEGGASEVIVFARLAAGVTLEAAEAELETVGLPPSLTAPETLRQLLPRVVPYTLALVSPGESLERWIFWLALSLVTLLLVPPCANIAILVYARTVTRHEEFAARYALGASRGRIVVQLWVEGLVLAAGSASAALVLARLALGQVEMFQRSMDLGLPFWMDFSLSATTILYVAGLAVLAALIAGAIPALQATGHRMQSGFRGLGSRTGMRLGATCTALIVAQVAVSVAVLPSAFEWAWGGTPAWYLGSGIRVRGVSDSPARDRPARIAERRARSELVYLSLRRPPSRVGPAAGGRARLFQGDCGGGATRQGAVGTHRDWRVRWPLAAGRPRFQSPVLFHGWIQSGRRRLFRRVRGPAPDRPRARARRPRTRATGGDRQPDSCR